MYHQFCVNETIVAARLVQPPYYYDWKDSDNKSAPDPLMQKLFPGIDYEVFMSLASAMRFNYELIEPGAREYVVGNGSVIDCVVDGVANMTAMLLTYTEERAEHVDFGYPMMYWSFGVVYKTPGIAAFRFALFKPMRTSVWVALAASVVLVMLIFALCSYFYYGIIHNVPVSIDHLLYNGPWVICCNILQQGVGVYISHNAFMVAFIAWHLPLFVFVSSYTGCLISFLAAPEREIVPFKDMKTFADALRNKKFQLIEEGETEENTLEILQYKLGFKNNSVYEAALENRPLRWNVAADDEEYLKILGFIAENPGYVHLGQSPFFKEALGDLDGLSYMDIGEKQWMSFAFQKNSTYTKPFSEAMVGATPFVELLEKKYWKKYHIRKELQKTADSAELYTPMGLDSFVDVFWCLFAGMVAGCCLLCAERFYFRLRGMHHWEIPQLTGHQIELSVLSAERYSARY